MGLSPEGGAYLSGRRSRKSMPLEMCFNVADNISTPISDISRSHVFPELGLIHAEEVEGGAGEVNGAKVVHPLTGFGLIVD